MSENSRRFGLLVRQRRTELGLTHLDVSQAGGPSTTTMTKIENDLVDGRISRLTLQRIDDVLHWSPGSAQRGLLGGDIHELAAEGEGSPEDVLASLPDRLILQELERRLARRAEERDGDGNAAPTNNVTNLPATTPTRSRERPGPTGEVYHPDRLYRPSATAHNPELPDDLAARTTGSESRVQQERDQQDQDAGS